MEADVFFNDGQNNQPLGFFSTEDEKIFLTVEKADSKENFSTNGVWIIDQYTDLASPYWSSSTSGFYIPNISKSIPGDAVKVDTQRYKELLKQQANGAEIVTDVDGQPTIAGRSVAQITGLQHDLLETNTDTLGHMRVGVGLTVDPGGVVNIAPASANGIGGIQIGDGLAVDDMGKLTLSGDSALPGYTEVDKEKILAIKNDGSGLNWVASESSIPLRYVEGVGYYKDNTGWHSIEPAGKIIASLASIAPPGALQCSGQRLNSYSYPELFSALYPALTPAEKPVFDLPDLTGRFLKGATSLEPAGNLNGENEVLLQRNQLPAHRHYIDKVSIAHYHTLNTNTLAGGSHSHTVTGYKTSKGSTDDGITVLEYPKGGAATTAIKTSIIMGHSHSINANTGQALYNNGAPLPQTDYFSPDDTGSQQKINIEPANVTVNYFIYTGLVPSSLKL